MMRKAELFVQRVCSIRRRIHEMYTTVPIVLLKYWLIGSILYRLLSIFYGEEEGEEGGKR